MVASEAKTDALAQALAAAAGDVETALEQILPATGADPGGRLAAAMRYSVFGGGKRLRPFLTLNAARLCGAPEAAACGAAAAVELVHCYSLVHDDLPAMDDDDWRRGRPTTHRAYDEATAILAGDALLTLAFEVMASLEDVAADVCCALVAGLAQASGIAGMVGGQSLDLAAIDDTVRIARLKTAALMAFACEAGAILGAAPAAARAALRHYGVALGLAFQITDDLLDAEGDAVVVGKPVRRDAVRGKTTAVSMLGVPAARARAAALTREATAHLAVFGAPAWPLQALALSLAVRER